MQVALPREIIRALEAIRASGGRPLVVGGAIRDAMLGAKTKDFDIEVHGIEAGALREALGRVGEVDEVGASFGVMKLRSLNADFSLPRKDSKVGPGHRGFLVETGDIGIVEAARRRDFTVNSMAWDPNTGELFDPFGGARDISEKLLRPTDEMTFLDDPLRALRAVRFVSKLDFGISAELIALCSYADLSELPGERIFQEWLGILSGEAPGSALQALKIFRLTRFFPELHAIIDCPQEKEWHPEGDVYTHTAMACQVAISLTKDEAVLFAVLCHDFGKPSTTKVEDGRIRSKEHEEAGIEPARTFMQRLRAPNNLTSMVCVLVGNHLAPAHFVPDRKHSHKRKPAGLGAYRRLARKLYEGGASLQDLYLVSKADHLGRTTEEALRGEFPSGEEFLRRAQEIKIEVRPEPDAVTGKHLIERGYKPGPEIGRILRQCRDVQYEMGISDSEEILDIVLAPPGTLLF